MNGPPLGSAAGDVAARGGAGAVPLWLLGAVVGGGAGRYLRSSPVVPGARLPREASAAGRVAAGAKGGLQRLGSVRPRVVAGRRDALAPVVPGGGEGVAGGLGASGRCRRPAAVASSRSWVAAAAVGCRWGPKRRGQVRRLGRRGGGQRGM